MGKREITRQELELSLEGSVFMSEVFEKLGYSRNPNDYVRRRVQGLFDHYNIDNKKALGRNKFDTRCCPVCGKKFKVRRNESKTTCSRSCANTYFRSGADNPNWSVRTLTELLVSTIMGNGAWFVVRTRL